MVNNMDVMLVEMYIKEEKKVGLKVSYRDISHAREEKG